MSELRDDLQNDEAFEELAAGYFDQVLDDAELAQFKQMLRADDRRVRRFAELAQLHQMIESEITYHQRAQRFNLNPTSNDHGPANALAELASLYEDNLDPSVSFAAWREEQTSRAQAARRRVLLLRFMIGGACAALIAVATVFAVTLIGNGAPETPIADQQDEPDQPPEIDTPVSHAVATLTATHNAQWAARALAPGDALRSGQRLTLTHGFAEITTNRGAVAILEAPATIELLENDNALRLVQGKLVGVVETDRAQGFMVRTPILDVVDLGTEFGVDVQAGGAIRAEVFVGEVSYALKSGITNASGTTHQSLLAGQAIQATQAEGVQRVQPAPLTFVRAKEFASIVAADASAYHRWMAYSYQLRRDPDLLAYYSFDPSSYTHGAALNLAQRTSGRFDAKLGDGQAMTAPSPGADRFGHAGQALTFDRQHGQAVYVPDWPETGELEALTISCWFRLSEHAGAWSLLVTQWSDRRDHGDPFAYHLGLRDARTMPGPPGRTMGLQAHTSFDGTTSNGPGWDIKDEPSSGGETTARDGWVHVALTIQCGGGPIRLYKNGIEINTAAANYLPEHLPMITQPLVIGSKATYRDIPISKIPSEEVTGFFDGQIDDVAILRRALTAEEVWTMFDAGRPDNAGPVR